jgi:hypothetical protein
VTAGKAPCAAIVGFVGILEYRSLDPVMTLLSSCMFLQVRGLAPVLGRGAGERIRTADLPFTRRLLCQLSYTGGGLRAC